MLIREASQHDAPQLLSLLRQLGYAAMNTDEIAEKVRLYSAQNNKLLVFEEDRFVCAFIALHVYESFHSPGRVGRITAFCVDERFRSKGVGQRMMDEAEKYFRESGCTRVEVTSNNRRKQAHAFYLRRGYIEDSRKFVLGF